MELIPLGTSSATPTRERAMSAYALRFSDGRIWLFDCAEGTQLRILQSELKPPRIERILISHLHGDHVLGLPGLLLSMALHGRQEAVHIHGPLGLQELVHSSLRLTNSHLPFPLHIEELASEPGRITDPHCQVDSIPIAHSVPSYAFRIRLPAQRGRVDMQALRAAGIGDGPLIGRLAAGEDITTDDGLVLRSRDVLGPERAGPCLLLCGDTSDCSSVPAEEGGLDLLLHEATYADDMAEKAATWGHSCAADAGRAAARLGARLLVISHFSARYGDRDSSITIDTLVRQAAASCPGCTVLPARDLQPIVWDGHAFTERPCQVQPAH